MIKKEENKMNIKNVIGVFLLLLLVGCSSSNIMVTNGYNENIFKYNINVISTLQNNNLRIDIDNSDNIRYTLTIIYEYDLQNKHLSVTENIYTGYIKYNTILYKLPVIKKFKNESVNISIIDSDTGDLIYNSPVLKIKGYNK